MIAFPQTGYPVSESIAELCTHSSNLTVHCELSVPDMNPLTGIMVIKHDLLILTFSKIKLLFKNSNLLNSVRAVSSSIPITGFSRASALW